MNSPLDPIAALRTEIEAVVNGKAGHDDLRKMRDDLTSSAIKQQFRYAIGTLNDPDAVGNVIDGWTKLLYNIGEHRGSREFDLTIITGAGVGGSVGTLGGALLGAASAALPPVIVFVIGVSAYIGGRSYFAAKRVAKEIVLLKQIEAAIDALIGSVGK